LSTRRLLTGFDAGSRARLRPLTFASRLSALAALLSVLLT
jgi:hypothetical protein